MITRIELVDGYEVVVENDADKKRTQMGVGSWVLMFTTKQEVLDHIALLTKALEFWEYESQEQDDCLDKMTPSDLRLVVGERDRLRAATALQADRIAALPDTHRIVSVELLKEMQVYLSSNRISNQLRAIIDKEPTP